MKNPIFTAARQGALVLCALVVPSITAAQQFVVDDAAIVDPRACQLEAWHGEVASWILPACQLIPNLEITAGVGFIAENGSRTTEYVLQGKYIFRDLAPNDFGIGLVAGLGVDPLAQATGRSIPEVFAYVPASLSVAGDRLILHANLGWHFERDEHEHNGVVHEEAHHALTWGVRGDVMLSPRFTAIGEFFGEDRFRPEYQVGLRSGIIPDLLLVDVSWGGHTAAGESGAGWAVGFAWTPPSFF